MVEQFFHSEATSINAAISCDTKTGLPLPQTLHLRVEGQGVLYFEEHARGTKKHASDILTFNVADVLSDFLDCANAGMFAGDSFERLTSHLRLLKCEFDLSHPSQDWWFSSSSIDAGTYRILLNFFSVLGIKKVLLNPAKPIHKATIVDICRCPYPGCKTPEFDVVRDQRSLFETKNRGIQIHFIEELRYAAAETIVNLIDQWSKLVMLGGYTETEHLVEDSGAIPDGAYQMDSHTIEQSFTEFFQADESAFLSLLNYLIRVHDDGLRIEKILIY